MRRLLHSAVGRAIVAQYLTLAIGVAWSRTARASRAWYITIWEQSCYADDLLTSWLAPAGLAVLALAVSTARARRRQPSEKRTFGMLLGLTAYATAIVFLDPFKDVADETNGLIGVGLVLPPFFWYRYLAQQRQWLAISALVLFLATCIAALLNDASNYWGGDGFFAFWQVRECR